MTTTPATYDIAKNAADMGATLGSLAGTLAAAEHMDTYPGARPTFQLGVMLTNIDNVRTYADDCIVEVVRAMRVAGASWREIGDALNISKQAAQQRFGRA